MRPQAVDATVLSLNEEVVELKAERAEPRTAAADHRRLEKHQPDNLAHALQQLGLTGCRAGRHPASRGACCAACCSWSGCVCVRVANACFFV